MNQSNAQTSSNQETTENSSKNNILELPPQKRIPYVWKIRVKYKRGEEITKKLQSCYDSVVEGAREPECLLITGPKRVGKSTIIESFAGLFPRTLTETGTIIPVSKSIIGLPVTPANVMTDLLESLGDHKADRGTTGGRRYRADRFLEDCQVRMVVFDEFQHMKDRENERILYTTLDWMKTIIKKHSISCVLTGINEQSEEIIRSNDQLAGLFPDPEVLAPFKWDERADETIKEFKIFLQDFEYLLPFRQLSHLETEPLANNIFLATEGYIGFISMLLRHGAKLALADGKEKLTEHYLKIAFDNRLGGIRRGIVNPFVNSKK